MHCPRPVVCRFAVDNFIFDPWLVTQFYYCMENDSQFSQVQGLELIESMINKARNRFSENGHLYLLWGWTVLICSIAQFILLHFVHYTHHYVVWVLTWLAVIYQLIYLNRKQKRTTVKTYTDEILRYVWITFVILMFLFGFLFGQVLGGKYYTFMNPIFLALYGMPTFLSGIILQTRPLMIGGICCWVLSVIATLIPYHYQLLLLSLAVVIAWIVPGYALQARFKKENA